MSDDTLINILAICLGIPLVLGVIWLSVRGPTKARRHNSLKRRTARRDNDRNVPPDTF